MDLRQKNPDSFSCTQVDQKVALINSKTADIKLLESKFNNIESMMIDLSARHKQIATMEVRLDEVKGNIEFKNIGLNCATNILEL